MKMQTRLALTPTMEDTPAALVFTGAALTEPPGNIEGRFWRDRDHGGW